MTLLTSKLGMTINDELLVGHSHHQAGRLENAKTIYESILLKQPHHFDALQLLGMLYTQMGLDLQGLDLLLKAVDINSTNPIVFNNLGLLQQKLKMYSLAVENFDKAIALNPDFAEAFYNKGISLQCLSDFKNARSSYLSCLSTKPDFFPAYINLGIIAEILQENQLALEYYLEALKYQQNHGPLYFNLGNVYRSLNLVANALNNYDLAIYNQKNYKEAFFNKAVLLEKNYQYTSALEAYSEVLKIDENYIDCYLNKSIILCKLHNYHDAKLEIEKGLAFKSCDQKSLNQYGIVLRHLKMHALALEKINELIGLDPLFSLAYVNKANILVELNQFDLALENYDHALELEASSDSLRWNRALLLLHMKKFNQGWLEYEFRWSGAEFKTAYLNTTLPQWKVGDDNKRLLIWSEQGIGTEFMFSVFLSQAHQLSSHIKVKVDPRGLEIYRRSFPELEFFSSDIVLDEKTYDCHLPIGSLPQYLFDSEISFMSWRKSYLKVNTNLSNELRAKLKRSNPLVGISWTTKSQTTGKDRTICLEKFFETVKGVKIDFVSLQYGDVKEEINEIRKKFDVEIQSVDSIDNFKDIDSLLSLINACDLVLSIDNSTVHFAGAIGKQTLVMLPFNADWRWFDDGEQCLWYPNTQLLRQSSLGQWYSVFKRVKTELALL